MNFQFWKIRTASSSKTEEIQAKEEGNHLAYHHQITFLNQCANLCSKAELQHNILSKLSPYFANENMNRFTSTILLLIAIVSSTSAFSTAFMGSSRVAHSRSASSNGMSMRVVDIDSEAAFDKTISSAGESLVIVDYSTTWCGPCKGEY